MRQLPLPALLALLCATLAVPACSTANNAAGLPYGNNTSDASLSAIDAAADATPDSGPAPDVPAGSLKIGGACDPAKAFPACTSTYSGVVHCDEASGKYKAAICSGSTCEYAAKGAHCKGDDFDAGPTDTGAGDVDPGDSVVAADVVMPMDMAVGDTEKPDGDATMVKDSMGVTGPFASCADGQICAAGADCLPPLPGMQTMCLPHCNIADDCPAAPGGQLACQSGEGDGHCVMKCSLVSSEAPLCPMGMKCQGEYPVTGNGVCGFGN